MNDTLDEALARSATDALVLVGGANAALLCSLADNSTVQSGGFKARATAGLSATDGVAAVLQTLEVLDPSGPVVTVKAESGEVMVCGAHDGLLFLAEFPTEVTPEKARAASIAALAELGWNG